MGVFPAILLCLAQPPGAQFDRLIGEAAALMRRGQIDPAIGILNKALALDPRSAAGHLLLGQAYLAKSTPEFIAEAKAEFQQARDLDPVQPLPSFFIAKIDIDLGRLRQAEGELRRALTSKPGEHYLLALLAETRRRQGFAREAVELASKALAAGPEALPVHYYRALARRDLSDNEGALADLELLLATPHASADAFIAAGEIHLGAGRMAAAEVAFRKAIALDPGRAQSHLRLAQTLRRLRKFDAALAELKTVESAPQLSSAYFQTLLADAACERGLILIDRGDAKGARAAFQRALEIDPSHGEAGRRIAGKQ